MLERVAILSERASPMAASGGIGGQSIAVAEPAISLIQSGCPVAPEQSLTLHELTHRHDVHPRQNAARTKAGAG